MPIARFELPDGRIGRFEVPEGTSQDDAMSLIEEHLAANPIAPSAQRPLPEGVTPSDAGAGRGSVVPHGPTLRERLFDRNVRSNVQPMKRRGGTRSEAKVFTPTGTDTTMSDVTGAVGDAIKGIAGMAAEKVIGVAGDMYNQEAPPEPPPSALDDANPLGYSRPLAYPQTPLEAASGASIRPGAEPRFQAAIDAKRAPPEATKMPIGASLAVDVRESTKNPVARGAAAGVAQLGQTGVGAVRLTADLFGADKVADFAADTDKTAKAFASGSTTDLRGSEKLVADVTASILNSAPAVAVGAVGGPAMRTLFAQSALAEYNEGRNAGFGTEESLKRAGIMGLAEAIGERAGFPEQIKLIKSLAKHIPTGELSKAFGSMLAKEIPGEQLTTAMQFMADKMGPAALRPDATLDQYLDQAGETLKVTIAQTAVMGGGPAAIGSTRNAIQNADQTIASTKPAQLDPQELIADAINQAASEFGLSAKAAVRLRDAAMERTGNQAVEMAARAMDEFERAGMTKKPGAKAGFLATLQQRVDAVKQEMEARAAAQPEPEPAPVSPAAPVAEGAPPVDDFTGLDAPSEPVAVVSVAPPAPVDAAAHAAATSPENDLPEPTPAQKSAGNYRLGHTRIAGLNISIENPQGSERSGTDADGKAWAVRMNDHYGYIRSTVGKDGDHIDTFVKAGTPEDYDGGVLVIDQKSPNGRFDEHKVMIGYDDARQAIEAYRSNFDAGWDGVMSWHALDMPNFKAWLGTGNHNQPAAKWKPNDISDVADASSAPVGSGDERGAAVARSGGDSRPVADERRMDRGADTPTGSGLPVEPVADGDRRDAALTPRILGRVGTTPATATPLELRSNEDGTLTPWHEGHELLDFDSGDPVKLPAGMSDADALATIKLAGSLGRRAKVFTTKEPDVTTSPAPAPQAQADQAGAQATGVEQTGIAGEAGVPAAGAADAEAAGVGGAPLRRAAPDTPAFEQWFGDSKVRDETGAPKVMFHGTNKSQDGGAFKIFDAYSSNYGLFGQGSYFTDDASVASDYTGKGKGASPTVYPVYLSIKNPIDMDAHGDVAAWEKAFPEADFAAEDDKVRTNEELYRAAEDYFIDGRYEKWEAAEAMQEGLRSMGYDGITHVGGGRVKSDGVKHRVYIAFQPEQVKSATGNRGTFDPGLADIALKRGDSTQGTDPAKLRTMVDALSSTWADAPPVEVVDTALKLPPDIVDALRSMNALGDARALVLPRSGKVYLIADQLPDLKTAQFALFHEVLGHYGLRKVLGDSYSREMALLRSANPQLRAEADAWMRAYGAGQIRARVERGMTFDEAAREVRALAIEEALADRAGAPQLINGWKAFLARLQRLLRKLGLDGVADWIESHSEAETLALLARARAAVEEGAEVHAYTGDALPAASQADPLLSQKHTPEQQTALAKAGVRGPASMAGKVKAYYSKAISLLHDRHTLALEARQGALDQFTGISNAVQRDLGNLPVEQDPYIAARLANGGTSSVMRALLLHGQARWASNGQHLEKVDGTKGLLDILEPLGDDVNDWFGWMIGNRAARLMKEGRERNFTTADIQALQSLAGANLPKFQKAAVEYAAFKRSVLDVAEKAGLIDADSRKAWDYADYIPFYRQVDEKSTFSPTGRKGLAGQSSGIRTLKGGEGELNDPMENLLMNFSRLIDASLKNNALRKTIETLEGANSDAVHKIGYEMKSEAVPAAQIKKRLVDAGTPKQVLDVIPQEAFDGMAKMWAVQAPSDPDVVRVMVNGKPQFYRVEDPLLLRSLTSFVPFDFPGLNMMRWFKRLLTGTVTAAPDFVLRNFIRDTVAAQMITRDGFSPGKSFSGVVKSMKETGAFEPMLFAGASFQSGNINAADPTSTGRAMRRALRDRGINGASADRFMASVIDTPAKFWEKYRHLSEAIENANREAVFDAASKAGKSTTAAAFEAKDLMDFNLRGSWAAYQFLADVVPFLNARVQGLYRLGRAQPKRLVTLGLMMTAVSLLLAWANGGEDDYEALPDWDKDTYWHFWIGGEHFRLPKPFELGVAFATIPERVMRYAMGQDSGGRLTKRVWANLRDQLQFDPVPQMFRPALNVWANKDTFRDSPIEGMADEGKSPHMRYSASTSETARELLGMTAPLTDPLGLSPKRLEYLVNAYTGAAGFYAMALSDMAVRQIIGAPDQPAMRADDIPVVKAFYRIDPARSTVWESDFYTMREAVDQVYRDVEALKREGELDKAAEKHDANLAKLRARRVLAAAAGRLAEINKQRDRIFNDRDMSPDDKRQRLDELVKRRAEIARAAVEHQAVVDAF